MLSLSHERSLVGEQGLDIGGGQQDPGQVRDREGWKVKREMRREERDGLREEKGRGIEDNKEQRTGLTGPLARAEGLYREC